jgi:hypothetical protein
VKARFAVAPNFHFSGSWKDRLLVAEGSGWRAPHDDELASLALTTPGSDPACCCLFSVPAHMRNRFWAMLNQEVAEGTGNFDDFSGELASFLKFKELPPPGDVVCELLVQDAAGKVEAGDVWALINFADEPVLLAWPQLQLRLGPAEGCRMVVGMPPDVVPPPPDEMNVLLAMRLGPA